MLSITDHRPRTAVYGRGTPLDRLHLRLPPARQDVACADRTGRPCVRHDLHVRPGQMGITDSQ
jgi:hypothetical protein